MALTPRTDWDPQAWKGPAFERLREVLIAFEQDQEWPSVERINALLRARMLAALGDHAPQFEEQKTNPKRRREKVRRTAGDLYDGHIQMRLRIPTRACNWHDFFNACVWAWLPRAKQALSARQFAAASERVPASFVALPPTRSKEQDALALLDEGGVLQVGMGAELIFGHALLEHLVTSKERVRGFGVPVACDGETTSVLDACLARALEDRAWPPRDASPAVWIAP